MRLRQPHPQRISPKGFMHEAQTRNGVLCVLSGKKVLGSSSRPFVDQKEVAVAVLRGPSWTERSCRSPWPSVSSVDKRCCRCSSSRPFADQKEVAVAVLLSLRRQNKLQHSKCHQERSVQDFPQSPYSLQLQLMSIPFETESPRASQNNRATGPPLA